MSLLLVAIASDVQINAQVAIGNNVSPQPFSLLEIVADYTKGGLRLPQLTPDEILSLKYLILSLPDSDRLKADGLMVVNTQTSCVEFWKKSQFISICGDIDGPAEMDLNCGEFIVYPNDGSLNHIPIDYKQGTRLDGTVSYIKVPVTATRTGNYSITVSTGNGYSFANSGMLLDVGDHMVTLQGQGTPVNGGNTYFDDLTVTVNGTIQTDCNTQLIDKIPVAPATDLAEFTMDCENTVINGHYTAGAELGSENSITVPVNVTTAGVYSFSAFSNGMNFFRTGRFESTGNQRVTLLGEGTPVASGAIPITIIGDDTSSEPLKCDTTISVANRNIKILGLGSGIYQPGSAGGNYSARRILATAENFGTLPNSTVPVQGITIINGANPSSDGLNNFINNSNPDIIVIGYGYNPDANSAAILADYVKNNGVLLAFMENNTSATRVINAVCNSSISVSGGSRAGSVYQYADLQNDPVINGPFGNLAGEYWGEDASSTSFVSALPDNCVAYSGNTTGTGTAVTSFRHSTLGFIFAGDGGFLSNNNSGDGTSSAYPCKNTNGIPVKQTNYSRPVSNSIFYANAIAWAINYIQANTP